MLTDGLGDGGSPGAGRARCWQIACAGAASQGCRGQGMAARGLHRRGAVVHDSLAREEEATDVPVAGPETDGDAKKRTAFGS